MADKKISQLTTAAALTGTEAVPVVQSGATVKTTTQDIANLAALGYTAENVANKSTTTSLGTSNTLYPTQNAVKVYADTVAAAAAAGKELLANKSINTALGTSDTLYPTQNAVKVYVDGSVAGLLDDRGSYTPSVTSPGAYPSTGGSGGGGAIQKGDLWFMSASGFLGTTAVAAGATVRALVNTPGQTAANWNILSAGAISITTPTLDDVTTAGNVSSNSMTINTDGGGFMAVTTVSDFGQASLTALLGQGGTVQLRNTFGSIGTIKADNLGVNRTYQLPDAAGTLALTSDIGLPYKVLVANINWNGSSWSIPTIYQNTLGGSVTISAFTATRILISGTGLFTVGKTVVVPVIYGVGQPLLTGYFEPSNSNTNDVSIKWHNTSGAAISPTFAFSEIKALLEIRVYP